MNIIIASLGRAHLLDCARELQKKGHNVLFYSATPKSNFKKYKLTTGGVSLTYYIGIFYLIKKFFPNYYTQRLYSTVLDFIVCLIMPRCDIFICQSPNFQFSMKTAKRKGAITILDRGTSHIDIYDKLALVSGEKKHKRAYVKYDKRQYYQADYITIASDFVKQGFLTCGFDEEKLFVNPYGVSLQHFYPTICTMEYDCIVVGQWSLRKGSNLVRDAFANTNIRILHVGSIADTPFHSCANFKHIDSVPETELFKYYAKAKIFLFPSIEDGFGLVLLQAAACGLPIVCSSNCGGTTLKRIIGDVDNIHIMEEITSDCLRQTVLNVLSQYSPNKNRTYCDSIDKKMSWEQYGERYNEFLQNITSNGQF